MTRSLWLLLGLQVRGWGRYLARNLRTVRGAIFAVVGFLVIGSWLATAILGASSGGMEPEQLRRYGPAALVGYCLLNVLFATNYQALYFSPAEINFLFAGPFSRRDILAYKIALTLLVGLPATLFMTALVRIQGSWPMAAFVAILLVYVFMQLFGMVLSLIAISVGARLFSRTRQMALILLGLLVVLLVIQTGISQGWKATEMLEAVLDSSTYHVVSWPLQAFIEAALAQSLTDLAINAAIALGFNVVLVAVIFGLDAQYLEISASVSARRYAHIQRLRGQQVSVESDGTPASKARSLVPDLPYLWGIGPILWRQLTGALRGLGKVILVVFIIGLSMSVPFVMGGIGDNRESLVPMLGGVGVWLTVFLTALVPFDFRGDLDRIAFLKTLPINPWCMTIGQLITPVLILSAMQWLGVALIAILEPAYLEYCLMAALYVPAFTFFLIGLENLLFLLFPVRIAAATPGDFQAIGRNVLLTFGKMLGLGVVLGVVAVAAWGAYAVTEQPWVAVLVSWPILALSGVALVPFIALAFEWFDVGRDVPA